MCVSYLSWIYVAISQQTFFSSLASCTPEYCKKKKLDYKNVSTTSTLIAPISVTHGGEL